MSSSACSAFLVSALLSLAAVDASAADPGVATRDAARDLARRGLASMQQHDCRSAVDLFTRAYSLVPAPTIALLKARCLAELGRLIEAADSYETVAHAGIDADSPDAFKRAVVDARGELGPLRARIPHLRVALSGAGATFADVRLDRAPLPRALVGVEVPVDPGRHVVSASVRGGAPVSRTVEVAERQHDVVTLAVAPARAPAPPEDRAPAVPRRTGNPQRTWGLVALGVGGAGLATGLVTALFADGRASDLDHECAGNRCPPAAAGDLAAFHALRTTSLVGYAVGFASMGAGALLFFSAPREAPREAHVTPWVGPGAAGVAGAF